MSDSKAKNTKPVTLFFILVVVILAGFACTGVVLFLKQIINHALSWCGLSAILVESGFFCALGICFVFTGYCAAQMFRNFLDARNDVIIFSAAAGLITGLIWLFLVPLLTWYNIGNGVYHNQIVSPINLVSIPALVPHLMGTFVENLPFFLVFFVSIAGLGAAGALCSLRGSHDSPNENLSPGTGMQKPYLRKNMMYVFIAGILLCILLPSCICIIGSVSGIMEVHSCDAWSPISMNVTRTGNETITFVMSRDFSGHAWARLSTPESRPLQVFVDGRDFSNQSVILGQGLTDTISPGDGINNYSKDSSFIIQGPNVRNDDGRKRDVVVISFYDRDNPWVIVDTVV